MTVRKSKSNLNENMIQFRLDTLHKCSNFIPYTITHFILSNRKKENVRLSHEYCSNHTMYFVRAKMM